MPFVTKHGFIDLHSLSMLTQFDVLMQDFEGAETDVSEFL